MLVMTFFLKYVLHSNNPYILFSGSRHNLFTMSSLKFILIALIKSNKTLDARFSQGCSLKYPNLWKKVLLGENRFLQFCSCIARVIYLENWFRYHETYWMCTTWNLHEHPVDEVENEVKFRESAFFFFLWQIYALVFVVTVDRRVWQCIHLD